MRIKNQKPTVEVSNRRSGKRIFLWICFTGILVHSTAMQLQANAGAKKLTLSLKQVRVQQVFKEIFRQTGISFLYNEGDMGSLPPVSINVSNATVQHVLEQCFLEQPYSFIISDNTVTVILKEKNVYASSIQESFEIKGTITDEKGIPLQGATIKLKGTDKGTTSDENGKFTIEVPAETARLEISFLGYKTIEIPVSRTSTKILKISLTINDSKNEEEVVVVGYGKQKKGLLTGSVASIKSEALTVSPMASTANTLAGRLPGLISLQSSGQPGADAANLSIRGFGNALVIVDGVEASFNNVDPNQIEEISILKDGSASIYGARAGNGVILVTTKRGSGNKPIITINASKTFQGVTKMLKPLTAGQYVELSREAHFNGGGTEANAPYTLEAMEKYYQGNDPLYPNTDWYKELIRDWAPQQQHNLSVRGGSEKIKYYGFLGFLDQETMIKKNGGNYRRYNIQSNIDAKITNQLALQFDLAAVYENKNYSARPSGIDGDLWQDYWTTLPIYPAHFPDPTKVPYAFGAGTGGLQVTSNTELSGYNRSSFQNYRGTLILTYDIQAVRGLSFKLLGNYIQNNNTQKIFQKPVLLYTWDPASNVYTVAGSFGGKAILDQFLQQFKTSTTQASLNYSRTFNNEHSITALALFETIDYRYDSIAASRKDFLSTSIDYLFAGSPSGMSNGGSAVETGREGFVGRLNYGYKNKYLLETILRSDASAKFSPKKRWGNFPSISIGWVLSKENFMKHFASLDNLKLKFSYGKSGNDAVGNFQYLTGYNFDRPYLFGNAAQMGLISTGLANPFLTWEQITISNIGLQFSFFKRQLFGELDVFYRRRNGIPATKSISLPSTFGATLPQENINSIDNRGFDLNLGTTGNISGLQYNIMANISWSRAKWIHYEEPNYTDPDLKRILQKSGQWVNAEFGYKTDGLFNSQAEISAMKYDQDGKGNSSLRPGDIKFVDVNGDLVIDYKDQVQIGKGNFPQLVYGLNFNLKYKNFDFSTLLQGAAGYDTYVNLGAQSSTAYNLRWNEINKNPRAIVPRIGSIATTAGYFSDYFLQDASYLRLKTIAIGAGLPTKWMKQLNLAEARIYLAGTNVITFSKLNKYGIDAEAPNAGYYYPQQRTVSIGIKLSF